MDAQIQSEGGYNPKRWGDSSSDGYCSWGSWQNYVCMHMGWSRKDATYIYNVLTRPQDFPREEFERLKEYEYLLDATWQVDELIAKYEQRKGKNCKAYSAQGIKLTGEQYCQIRLHNWNGGNGYVNKVINKYNQLYL